MQCLFCCFKGVNPGRALCCRDWRAGGVAGGSGGTQRQGCGARLSPGGVREDLSHARHGHRGVMEMAEAAVVQWGCRLGATLSMPRLQWL